MKKSKLFLAALILSFILNPYPVFAEIVKLWGEGVNISNTDGTAITIGYGRKASDGSLFAYYEVTDSYYNNTNIFLKKINKNGSVLWEKLVTTTQSRAIVDLVPDKNGGTVAVWMTGYELRAKRFDSNGNEYSSWGADGVVASSYGAYGGHGIRNSVVSDGAQAV